MSAFKLNVVLLLTKLCPCFIKPSKEEKFYMQGMQQYKQEIDIIEFFRTFLEVKAISKRFNSIIVD